MVSHLIYKDYEIDTKDTANNFIITKYKPNKNASSHKLKIIFLDNKVIIKTFYRTDVEIMGMKLENELCTWNGEKRGVTKLSVIQAISTLETFQEKYGGILTSEKQ